MAYIFITNNDTDTNDMINNCKASAYHPYTGPRVCRILATEQVYIYRTETGIIAYGCADERIKIMCNCTSGTNSRYEDNVHLSNLRF